MGVLQKVATLLTPAEDNPFCDTKVGHSRVKGIGITEVCLETAFSTSGLTEGLSGAAVVFPPPETNKHGHKSHTKFFAKVWPVDINHLSLMSTSDHVSPLQINCTKNSHLWRTLFLGGPKFGVRSANLSRLNWGKDPLKRESSF